jgi:hypothetical protein
MKCNGSVIQRRKMLFLEDLLGALAWVQHAAVIIHLFVA